MKLVRPSVSFVSISLLISALVGTPSAAATAEASPALQKAKAETDRILEFLRANPKADWQTLRKKIEPIAAEWEASEMTRQELQDLKRYFQGRSKDLEPRIKGLRRDIEASEAPKSLARSINTGSGATCYSYCVVFLQIECGTDRLFGACLGGWNCEDQMGGHMCLEVAGGDIGNPASCKNDNDCPRGYGCATWAFKENECVEKCERDSDCDPGQKCKKPLGTSFKRCK